MIITNIENYLTLTGLLVDAFNNEEEIEYPYIGRLSDESELMVECELDLSSLCNDYNIDINDVSNIKLVVDGSTSNIRKLFFCNSEREILQSFNNNASNNLNLSYLKINGKFVNQLLFYLRSSEDYDYAIVEALSCEIITGYQNNFHNKPFYKTKELFKSIDNLISYNIDLYRGRIDFSRNIVSLYGNKMPLKLSQSFNAFKDNNYFDYWKLNLEQKLYYSNNKYYWIDSNYKTHEFNYLSNNLYYDTDHTGLLLRIALTEYVITNDIDKFYHFNASMNLVSIESKRGIDSLFVSINKSSNTITFVDGMGRITTYSSNGAGDTLILPDSTILNFVHNSTNDVFVNLDGSQITYSYSVLNNIKLLNSATLSYGKTINFTYDENCRIIKIEELASSTVTKRMIFEYFDHYVAVTTINHPKDLLISTKTGYSFNKNEEFVCESDLIKKENYEQADVRYYNRESYEQFICIIRGAESQNIERHQQTNYFAINVNSLNSDEEYVVYAKLDNKKYHLSGSNVLEINLVDVWPACYFVRQLFYVDYSFDGELILAAKIRPEEYTNEYIILEVNGNIASLIDDQTFFLMRTKHSNSFDVVRSSSEMSYDYIERRNNQNLYWNRIHSLRFVSISDCDEISLDDFNVNLWNLSKNNQVILWYNDLSKAFIYDGNESVLVNGNEQVEVSDLIVGHLDIVLNKKTYTYLENLSGSGFNFYKIINTNWNIEKGLVKQRIDQFSTKISEEDSLGNITYFDLDNYGRCISTRKITALGTFKTETSYIYTSTEFKEIFIDNDGLSYEKTFDLSTGLLKSSKEPNGNYTYYTYDSSFRMINISSLNNSNLVSYVQDKINSLDSSDGNNFNFSYNNFDEVNNVKINNSNHLFKNYIKCPIKESVNTLYANSKGQIEVYNRFGNLVQKGSITSLASNGLIGLNNIYGTLTGNYSNVNTYDFNDGSVSSNSVLRKSVYTNLTNPYSINYSYNIYGKLRQIEIPNEYKSTMLYSNYDLLSQEDFIFVIQNQNFNSSNYYSYSNIDALNPSRLINFENYINDFTISSDYYFDSVSRISSKENRITMPFEYGYTSIIYSNTYKTRIENNVTYLSNKLASRSIVIEQDNYEHTSTRQEFESFTYNNNGFLESITSNNVLNRFLYDDLNRLIREDNELINRTFTYTYNYNGNITSKSEYYFTTGNLGTPINIINYGYNTTTHKDQLISWNGYTFTYDNAGNPISYKDAILTRNNSNRLSKYLFTSTNYIDFEYNASGVRREKVVTNAGSSIRHTYTYYGNKLISEKIYSLSPRHIVYIYEKDEIIGFYTENLLPYLYRKNVLGDVIEIYDYLGEVVAQYTYDAWGNCEIVYQNDDNIGDLNPIRYRSYYYDDETGLYYLISRYYDPETGRFISPDAIGYWDYKLINGLNIYCYCFNNPISSTDKLGNSPVKEILMFLFGMIYYIFKATLYLTSNNRDVPDGWVEDDDINDLVGYSMKDFGTYVVYFHVSGNNFDDEFTEIKIYDSSKYSATQIRAFLEWLKEESNSKIIDIDKMLNEWARHVFAYRVGFNTDSTKDADIYLNHNDENRWYSFIINWRLWF